MEIIIYLLKSAAILTLFYVIYILFLRKETHFTAHRFYLLAGVVASFLLPTLYFTQTVYIDPPVISEVTMSAVDHQPASVIVDSGFEIDWWNVLLLSYLIGCSFVFFRFVRELTSLILLLHNNPSKRYRGFNYVRVAKKLAPFSFFNYIVFNPELHQEDELQMILKHEQAHAFQWHSTDIILANLLIIIQWANPLAWLYKKSVEENLEFLADNATIISVDSKKDYQLALVRASSARYTPSLTTNFYKSFIKKRIIMLNKRTSKKHHVLKVATVLPLLAIFLWSFNIREEIAYKEVIPETVPETVSDELLNSENPSEINSEKQRETGKIAASEKSFSNTENLQKETIAEISEEKETNPIPAVITGGDIEFKITKNTTDAELEKMKSKLKKDHDIDLSYSIKRNKNKEITSISFQYSSKDSNGNYSISDDEAIADFVFYIKEDGKSGFYSEEVEARRAERAYARAERMKERSDMRRREIEKVREDRDRMREEIREERDVIRDEMTRKRREMKDRLREKRKSVIIESDDDDGGLFDDEDEEEIVKTYKIAGSGSNEAEDDIFVVSSGKGKSGKLMLSDSDHHIRIDKNTTDASLEKMKTNLGAKGVDFKYSKLKRNAKGEITSIRVTVDNNKGSKQTISAQADDGKPIDDLLIDIQ